MNRDRERAGTRGRLGLLLAVGRDRNQGRCFTRSLMLSRFEPGNEQQTDNEQWPTPWRTHEHRQKGDTKIESNSIKSPWIAPKICIEQIHRPTNLFPRNQVPGLIQIPEKIDQNYERKMGKKRTKITALNRKPRGQNEDLGLHSQTKSQQNTLRKSQLMWPLSYALENLTLGRKGGNEEWERGKYARGLSSSI
jgi:hypothetical protein